MESSKGIKIVVLVIGAITLFVGIYALILGKAFGSYFPALFLGVTLIGSAFMTGKSANSKRGE